MAKEVLRTLGEQVKPEHTALIIIDPQQDFIGTNGYGAVYLGWEVSRMQDAIRRLNHFVQKIREAGMMVIWVRTTYASETVSPNIKALWWHLGGKKQTPRGEGPQPKFLKEGSEGAKWWSEMTAPLPNEHVITKYHYDALEDTNLHLLLGNQGIKTLLITGVQTNVCCETTLRHASIKGYYAILVSDCTDTLSQPEYEATLRNVKRYFGLVVSSGEVLEALGELVGSKQL